MNKIYFGLLLIATLVITSCTETLDKRINNADLEKVKELVTIDNANSAIKSKYIIDNLSTIIGFAELGKSMDMDKSKLPTFREQIAELATDYDSTRLAKLKIRENNKKIKEFVELTNAKTICIDKYNGYLNMKLKFNNNFEKDILYLILNYRYVDKYDSEFFNEKTKLTDKVAKDFKGDVEITTSEKHNQVTNFMYTKVPVSKMESFLMKGLKVEVLGIVFKDKTELVYQNNDWKYFE